MKNFYRLGALALLVSMPLVTFAQKIDATNVSSLITSFVSFLNRVLVPLIFAVAFIVFLFGVFNYFIAGAANEEKRADGVKFITFGIIGFAVMISLWGLVNLLVNTFGFGSQNRPCIPTFDGAPCTSDFDYAEG
ncbi:MAG: hypothetical protein JWN64_313 [Parcubacteria group bacterium]|nr:hypothetical protein [Parcubacteria group bacterium]